MNGWIIVVSLLGHNKCANHLLAPALYIIILNKHIQRVWNQEHPDLIVETPSSFHNKVQLPLVQPSMTWMTENFHQIKEVSSLTLNVEDVTYVCVQDNLAHCHR